MDPRLLALTLAMATPPVEADAARWSATGHRLVARIAELRLTARTAQAVRSLLGGQSLAAVSLWADQVKERQRDTEPLHYVLIPLDADHYDPDRDCPQNRCIIAAIEEERALLGNRAASREERAEALRFLVHFMADLHQPLHVADDNDRGGTQHEVRFFGADKTLHQVWDSELIQFSGMDEPHFLSHLRHQMDSLDLEALTSGTVVDWAMEGHRIAVQHAYVLPVGERLGERYLQDNLPFVDRQLIAAGVRLARILNETLGAPAPAIAPRSDPADTAPRVLPATVPAPAPAAAPPPAPPSSTPIAPAAPPAPTPAPVPPPVPPRAQPTKGRIPASEAVNHLGEEVTIEGRVITVGRSKAGYIFLNFGAAYPNQVFNGVVLDPSIAGLQHLERVTGKRVRLHGVIGLYLGKPEIIIEDPKQILKVW
jgi:hypothetical protein